MFTDNQKKVILGLADIRRKAYTTADLGQILKRCYPELRQYGDSELEIEVTKVLYNIQ